MRVLVVSILILFSIAATAKKYDGIISRPVPPGVRVVPPKCKKQFENKFRQAAIDVLDKAMANGWKGYDGINFIELKVRIASKEVYIGCNPKNIITHYSNRSGGMYTTTYKTIYLNYIMQEEKLTLLQLSIVALHEHLGALGFEDNEGEITLALMFMSEHVNDGLRLLPDELMRAELLASNEGGTSTGSGGGGDPYFLQLKYEYFKGYYTHFVSPDFVAGKITLEEARRRLRRFLEIKLEFFVANRKGEEPKFEMVKYSGLEARLCTSIYKGGMSITVGVDYIVKNGKKAHTDVYSMMISLAEAEGASVRCIE